jgi:hypothetical protein
MHSASQTHPVAELLARTPAVVVLLGGLSPQTFNLRHLRVDVDLASVQAVCMQPCHGARGPMMGVRHGCHTRVGGCARLLVAVPIIDAHLRLWRICRGRPELWWKTSALS